jgi:hypothetical protein
MPDAAAMLPLAEVEHRIPGRMRLRVRARRGDAGFFRQAETALARVPGVRAVRATPSTGSILIEHGDEAAVLAGARERGLFDVAPPTQAPPARAEAPATLNLAAMGFAGAGLLQIARGRALGSATENLFNAHSTYFTSNQPWLAAVLAAFGLVQVARGEVLGSAVSLFLYAHSLRRSAHHQAVGGTV